MSLQSDSNRRFNLSLCLVDAPTLLFIHKNKHKNPNRKYLDENIRANLKI
ncbi:hypothetical protein EVA_07542 [gut metagenome]|uniref:Uncharacterized protein n=1 Tax=gut metagenome TaxID=749906 RepID=J9GV09_9ZZZZ